MEAEHVVLFGSLHRIINGTVLQITMPVGLLSILVRIKK